MADGIQEPVRRWRRPATRIFVLVMIAAIAIETFPGQFGWTQPGKRIVSPWLRWVGLSQGEWPLFAPNPSLNNAWVSAEVKDPQGQMTIWNSPYWAEISSWEKFYRFRHLNFYNRIHAREQQARDDLADYLARQLISHSARPVALPTGESPAAATTTSATTSADTWNLSLFRSQLQFSLPADGSLPTRDEMVWIVTSKNLAIRDYLP